MAHSFKKDIGFFSGALKLTQTVFIQMNLGSFHRYIQYTLYMFCNDSRLYFNHQLLLVFPESKNNMPKTIVPN